jgi:NADP-dependent 3-hydroxy acid dehydrogenase YdfG
MWRVDSEELAGRRALVTGGTQGVGAPIVSRLSAAGAKAATTARSARPSSDASDLFVRADMTISDGVITASRAVLERYAGLDVLVHSVGGSSAPAGGFSALTEDRPEQRSLPFGIIGRSDGTLTVRPPASRGGHGEKLNNLSGWTGLEPAASGVTGRWVEESRGYSCGP